jgi:hypothetical protein
MIKTRAKISRHFGHQEIAEIRIRLRIKPSFKVFEDGVKGKRILYFNRVESRSCEDPDMERFVDWNRFSYRLCFQSQFRMVSPYKVSMFSIGCDETLQLSVN